MNTNIDTANMPAGGTVMITNSDGSFAGSVTVTKREVYNMRAPALILAAIAVIAFVMWLRNRKKSN